MECSLEYPPALHQSPAWAKDSNSGETYPDYVLKPLVVQAPTPAEVPVHAADLLASCQSETNGVFSPIQKSSQPVCVDSSQSAEDNFGQSEACSRIQGLESEAESSDEEYGPPSAYTEILLDDSKQGLKPDWPISPSDPSSSQVESPPETANDVSAGCHVTAILAEQDFKQDCGVMISGLEPSEEDSNSAWLDSTSGISVDDKTSILNEDWLLPKEEGGAMTSSSADWLSAVQLDSNDFRENTEPHIDWSASLDGSPSMLKSKPIKPRTLDHVTDTINCVLEADRLAREKDVELKKYVKILPKHRNVSLKPPPTYLLEDRWPIAGAKNAATEKTEKKVLHWDHCVERRLSRIGETVQEVIARAARS